ncbi:O-antigen polymerase [Sphingomonas sp. Leaf37]|uniref:O-antigen polymerase n=1 Tax=Sphingomonas sp. Leaf37 TaxID=2876552 RepID=UPI0022A7FE73|nr:O-antigen polymerase [Sphingomonas sp. Leaf37]
MTSSFPIRRSAYTSPVVIFLAAWGITLFLYILQFSNILLYDRGEASLVVLAITLPFVFGVSLSKILNLGGNHKSNSTILIDYCLAGKTENLLKITFAGWIAVTLAEIGYSGGIPMLWSLTGSSKTYFDFGIPTIHGLMNAILLSLTTVSTFLGLATKQKKYYIGIVFLLVWGVIVISRNLIIVGTLQCLFLMFFIKGPPKGARVIWLSIFGLLAIIGFGWIGDLRSGAAAFFALAQPSSSYPTFLPSGFLWVYIYITTPLNNLIHQTVVSLPEWNWGLTNSMALLLPSVIRNVLYDSNTVAGDLVTNAFNVSSAFLDIYRDLGFFGIVTMSFLIGAVSQAAYNGNSVRSVLFSVVLLQSAVLSIFFNHYFYLPILFQYPMISFMVRPLRLQR